jgi:hypothetical protein
VTTWTGLTVFVQTEFHECLTNRAHKTILCKKQYAFWYIMGMRGIASARPVLKGHHFLDLSLKISYELNLYEKVTCLK